MDQLQHEGSHAVRKEPCPSCGSSNNLVRYSDGHGYCFSMGCGRYERGDMDHGILLDGGDHTPVDHASRLSIQGDVISLTNRKIREDTCQLWQYRVGKHNGKSAQFAYYFDDQRRPTACKVRYADKTFTILGDAKAMPLYGQWLWKDGGKKVVVVEGEIDALTVSQLQSNKWPTVSIPQGAQGAVKAFKKALEWLNGYEEVIIMFDMDEPGQAAAKACAELLPPGKAKIAQLPLKDPNECLKHGRGDEVINAMWNAKTFRPDGIVSIDDVIEEATKPIEMGLPWFLPNLAEATYGRRWGELITIGAGTGVGKTDFLTQQIAFDVTDLNQKVGVIFLEQPIAETAKRLAGKIAGKLFHVPGLSWTREDLEASLTPLKGRVHLYDHFGEMDWDIIKERIRYLVISCGCRLIYLDHLTAMADPSNERESIETIMKQCASLAQELKCIIHLVSHLSTPEGKSHEEGGRVTIKNFKGSRSIGFWSHSMLGLERDQQAEGEADRRTTCLRILKHRFYGAVTGMTFDLHYDPATGRLSEVQKAFSQTQDDEF